MKVLVTAFKPFNRMKNNYSMEVLNKISDADKCILDVVYDKCYFELVEKYDLNEYDYIIALGEARSRRVLTLEIGAKNISSCSIADNAGVIKQNEKIYKEKPEIIETMIDLENAKNIIELSGDAGKFVCNNLYYHLLINQPSKSVFIHIPNCEDSEENYIKYAKQIEKFIDSLK